MNIKKIFTKTNLVIVSIALAGLFIWSTANMRAKLSTVRSKLASTEVMLDIVSKEKFRLDSLEKVYKASIAQLDVIIVEQDKRITKANKAIGLLQDSLNTVKDNTTHVTADSSYNYIGLRIPPVAELKYRFDSVQVKGIHYNFIERDGLFILNNKKDLVIKDLSLSSYTKDNQINELKKLNYVYISKEAILLKEKESLVVEIKGLNKTVRQQKFQKLVSEGALIGIVGVVIVKALLK